MPLSGLFRLEARDGEPAMLRIGSYLNDQDIPSAMDVRPLMSPHHHTGRHLIFCLLVLVTTPLSVCFIHVFRCDTHVSLIGLSPGALL